MKSILQKIHNLPVGIIIGFALVLRTIGLWSSFWLDEAAQALESIRPFSQQLHIAEDFQPPLLHLLLHFVAQVSQSEAWLRLWGALIPGLITIYCTYRIAERLFSKKAAVITTLLLATSSFHVFYSQELRPYSLSAALAAVSWLVLMQAFFERENFTPKYIASYAIATTLGLYSTYLYPFVVISQAVYVFWKERQYIREYILSSSLAGLLFLPWIPYLFEQLSVGQALRQSLPGWENVVSIPQLKSLPLTLGKFMFGVLNIEINLFFLLITGAFLAGLFWALLLIWKHERNFLYSRQFTLIMCWLFVPLLTSWLISFVIPVVQPKRVMYLLPAFYIFTQAIVLQLQVLDTGIWEGIKRAVYQHYTSHKVQLRIVALTTWILLALNSWSYVAYVLNPVYQREDWRTIHHKITTEYSTDAAVVFAFDAAFAPWEWYDDGSYPVFATGTLTQNSTSEVEDKLKKASDYTYLLVFDYLRDLTDPERKIDSALQNLGYSEKQVFGLPNIGFVRIFVRQRDVLS